MNILINLLQSHGVGIEKIKSSVTPSVILIELLLQPGTRIRKVTSLRNEIEMSLRSNRISIIPIPENGTIGISIPHEAPKTLPLSNLVSSVEFLSSDAELPIVIGKTDTNKRIIADIISMPHLLIAGASGTGKSVALHNFIISLLFKKHPAELKLVLIDPKKVEFTAYAKLLNHFIAKSPFSKNGTLSEPSEIIYTIHSLFLEMNSRYELLHKSETSNICQYNEKFLNHRLNPVRGHLLCLISWS